MTKILKNKLSVIFKKSKVIKISTVYVFKLAFTKKPLLFVQLLVVTLLLTFLPFLRDWLWSQSLNYVSTIGTESNVFFLLILGFLIVFSLNLIFWIYLELLDPISYMFFNMHFIELVLKKLSTIDIQTLENPSMINLVNKVKANYTYRPANFYLSEIWFLNQILTVVISFVIISSFSILASIFVLISLVPGLYFRLNFGVRKWSVWDSKGDEKKYFNNISTLFYKNKDLIEIKINGSANYLINRAINYYNNFISEELKVAKKRTIALSISTIIEIIMFSSAVILGINIILIHGSDVGTFVFFVTILLSFRKAVSGGFKTISSLNEDALYVNDIIEFLNYPNKIVSGSKVIDFSKPFKIEFKNVWFKYPLTDKYIFEDLNITIQPGQNIAIVGENGAGKSTFIKLVTRMYDVDKGKILINGVDIKTIELQSYYSCLSYLGQEFTKYKLDVKSNIGLSEVSNMQNIKHIKESAKQSGAHDFIMTYNKNYDQLLSRDFDDGIDPSVGQWQKLALARSFFKNSRLLILDEPTSSIDPKAESEIFNNIFSSEEEKNSQTVILISHRFNTVRNSERIIVIENGILIEEGTHNDLISLGGKYKAAFELQKKGYK